MSDFQEFLAEIKKRRFPQLQVSENDLYLNNEVRLKPVIEKSDIFVDYSNSMLDKHKIGVNVYRDKRMLPLGFGAKYLNYHLLSHGFGAHTLIVTVGKQEINPNDPRYTRLARFPKQTENPYWFLYNSETGKYNACTSQAEFESVIAEIEALKTNESVMQLIWLFYDFLEKYWINKTFKKGTTNGVVLQIASDIGEQLYAIEGYHEMLRAFDDISQSTLEMALFWIPVLQNRISTMVHYLQTMKPDQNYDPHLDKEQTKLRFEDAFERCFRPGYHFHPVDHTMIPNMGQIFKSMQPAKEFVTEQMIREQNKVELDIFASKTNGNHISLSEYRLIYNE